MIRKTIFDIQELSVWFKSSEPAVKNISFNFNSGETIGIVGESGSGKTLTALSIIGLLPESSYTSGKVLFRSEKDEIVDLMDLNNKRFLRIRGKSISMIFQEPMSSLNPSLKCGPQVAEVLKQHTDLDSEELEKEVFKLFDEVDLPRPRELYKSYPHQLSGGQRQRVMIAMAIACKPDLIIADEPTTALDVTVQKVILELLRKLKNKYNTSILFISHDLGVIADIADKVLVMYNGEIVEQGTTKDVINDPQHPYTQGLLACRPPLVDKPHRLPTLDKFLPGINSGNISETGSEEEIPVIQKESEVLLRVSNLITAFPVKRNFFGRTKEELKAVNDVSFDLFSGETLGLVGESGCGKTSLGRSILQLIKSRQGDILYKGLEVNGLSGKQLRGFRKNLQIIFQDPFSTLNPGLTIGYAIMEPMIAHGLYSSNKQRKQKTQQLLERVALNPDHFNRYPHQFSGGQRQRIGIARALAVEPEMIICDESVSALDVSVQAQILNLMNELKEDFGLTYLFISHDLAVVRYMSDRIMVMQNGRIVERGKSDQIFNNPGEEYTQGLMDAIPRVGKA